MGMTAKKTAELCIVEFALPVNVKDFMEEITEEQRKEFVNSELMLGAKEMITTLHRLDIPMALATSSKKETFEIKTKKFHEIFGLIKVVVLGDDPAVREGKPAPDIFLEAARRLGSKPENCLALEDSPNGVMAAMKAGMQVVWIPDPAIDYSISHADLYQHDRVQLCKSLLEVELSDYICPSPSKN